MNPASAVLQAIVLFLFAVGFGSFICLVKGCLALRRQGRRTASYEGAIILKSPLVSPVSIILPISELSTASREQARQLVELHFGKHEVVLVLNGPSAADLATWTRELHLCLSARGAAEDLPATGVRGIYESSDPISLVVVDKESGSLGDAWNAGVNVAAAPIIGLLDPEAQFGPGILLSLIRPMLEDPGTTIAVLGVMAAPEVAGLPGRYGALDSLRVWLSRCAAFTGWNLLVPVPGSFMLVLRDHIVRAGGFVAGPLELFLSLHGHARASGKPYRVAFVPEEVSHRPPARTFADLKQTALREAQDFAGVWRARKSIKGGIGAIKWAFPALFCVLFVRPLLETVAYVLAIVGWIAGWIDPALAGLVLIATVGMGTVISMSAVVLRELVEFQGSDPARLSALFWSSIPENLGYRQLRNFWLIAGFLGKSPAAR